MLWRHREFPALWLAMGQSQFGDQLGRVALSILVFERTGSGTATAAVYGLTYLPAMLGGLFLSGLADRYPRRTLLVVCDLIRAAMFGAMALPAVPIWAVAVLLTIGVAIGAPHKAAEPTIVADMFTGDQYSLALGVRTATVEVAQLLGFALGGVLVAATGPRWALGIDGLTFLVSALLLWAFLARRPAAAGAARGLKALRGGVGLVWRNRRLRTLLAYSWLAGLWVVPEGLAAPYAAGHGGGPVSVGVLLAADPVGVLIGSLALSRWVPQQRRWGALAPLAALSGLPLAACVFDPPVAVAAVLWALTGILSSYQVLVVAEFVERTPAERRGQAIGVASSGLIAVQGIGIPVGGLVAAATGTAPAIAIAGVAGALLAVTVGLRWPGSERETGNLTSDAQLRRNTVDLT